MPTVTIREAKTQLSKLLDAVADGEEVIISKDGKPAAKLVPIESPASITKARFDEGQNSHDDDFDSPLPDDIQAAFEGKSITSLFARHRNDPHFPSSADRVSTNLSRAGAITSSMQRFGRFFVRIASIWEDEEVANSAFDRRVRRLGLSPCRIPELAICDLTRSWSNVLPKSGRKIGVHGTPPFHWKSDLAPLATYAMVNPHAIQTHTNSLYRLVYNDTDSTNPRRSSCDPLVRHLATAVALIASTATRQRRRPHRFRRRQPDQRLQGHRASLRGAAPGAKVLLNFGASGALLQQIAKGAPVDVFATADQETMDQAAGAEAWCAPATRRNFVRNTLVVIVPADSQARIAAAGRPAPAAPSQRIAIGMPASVPVGPLHQGRARSGQAVAGGRAEGDQRPERAPVARLRGARRSRCRLRLRHRRGAHEGQGARWRCTVPPDAPIRYPIAAHRRQRATRPRRSASSTSCCRRPAQAMLAQIRLRQALRRPGARMRWTAWTALRLSLKVAGWATAINLVLGVGVGYRAGAPALPGPRPARRAAHAADGDAADRARLLPAGADRRRRAGSAPGCTTLSAST